MNVKSIYISCLLALTPFVSHAMSIHGAARSGDYARVSQLVQDIPSLVNSRNQHGATPLHKAARKGHTNIVQLLLDHNADPNLQDNFDWTPLHEAAYNKHADIVQLLLDHNADPNVQNNYSRTPLHMAARKDHTNIAQLLLAHNADPNVQNNDVWTPLHRAAYDGHADTVQLLLTHNANPNLQDNTGRTPLHEAACDGNIAIAQLLLEHNANHDARDIYGWTPLDFATPEVRNAIEHPIKNACCTTLLYGHHPRCGANSILMQLPPAIMQDIVEHCKQIDHASFWALYGRINQSEAFANPHLMQSRYLKAYAFLKNHWLKVLVPTVAASALLSWYLLPS